MAASCEGFIDNDKNGRLSFAKKRERRQAVPVATGVHEKPKFFFLRFVPRILKVFLTVEDMAVQAMRIYICLLHDTGDYPASLRTRQNFDRRAGRGTVKLA